MSRVPLFGAGVSSKSPNITAQKRVNMYAEIRPEADKSRVVFLPTPGLTLLADFGSLPVRGSLASGDFLYSVHQSSFWCVNNAGTSVLKGSLLTSGGRVSIASGVNQIMLVDGTYGYIYSLETGVFEQITDEDFIENPISVAWQDGYFIVHNSLQFGVSELDNGLVWDSTERASAEANPDGILRLVANEGVLVLFGSQTTELWGNSGAQDFPYQRVGIVNSGIAATWSATTFGDTFIWLSKRREGGAQVSILEGSAGRVVSTPEIETIINAQATSAITGYSYASGGHTFYQLNLAEKSLLFDATSAVWSDVISSGSRHRGEMATSFLDRTIVSDHENGRVYTLSPDVYTDNGEPIIRELVSRHLFGEENMFVSRLWIDAETGVGLSTGQGSDPKVMLQVSRDGGHAFGNELWASLGKVGERLTRLVWRRLGVFRDGVFRIRLSDPVKFVVMDEGYL